MSLQSEVSSYKRWSETRPPICDDATWNRAVSKGNLLLRMMASDDMTAGSLMNPPQPSAQSIFECFPAEFQKWGYIEKTEAYCDMSPSRYGMEAALKGLDVSSASSAWKCCTAWHGEPHGKVQVKDQTYKVDGRTLRVGGRFSEDRKTNWHRLTPSKATGAKFATAVNVEEGVVMMTSRYSTRSAGALLRPPVTENFPELQKASDIVFGQWTHAAGSQTPYIRFIIAWAISNPSTQAIIHRALQTLGPNTRLLPYPGSSFSMDSEAGKALLGSPNGVAAGFLLAQHKAQLGNKAICRVTVFGHDSSFMAFNPVMVFHVR